ncbi:MAG TPA: hypothetical protein VGM56_29365, partial [Byssovorax sp.]
VWLGLLAVTACNGDHRDAPAPAPPPAPAPIDARAAADAAAPTPDARPVDVPPPGADAALVVGDHSYRLGFGYVVPGSDRLYLTLTTSKLDCAHKPSYGSPKGLDAVVEIQIPSGPGGRYFAGSWTPALAIVTLGHERTHLERAGMVFDSEYMNGLSGAESMIRIELPAKAAAGTRVTGELDLAGANLLGAMKLSGHLDLELCEALPVADLEKLPMAPPGGAAHGVRGGKAIPVARTVQAIVFQGSSTVANAMDVSLHRGGGDRPFIGELAFYAEPDVPCRGLGDETKPGASLLVEASVAGVTSPRWSVVDVAQPSSIALYLGKDKMEEVWPGAVILRGPIDTTNGAKLAGSVWSTHAGYSELKGSWGGTFEAVVCNQPSASEAGSYPPSR